MLGDQLLQHRDGGVTAAPPCPGAVHPCQAQWKALISVFSFVLNPVFITRFFLTIMNF